VLPIGISFFSFQPARPPPRVAANTYFPAMEVFDALLAELPSTTRFVIMMPPVYQTALPRPGTQEDADRAACKAALAERAGRPNGVALLDYLVDGPIARDPENFLRHGALPPSGGARHRGWDHRGIQRCGGRPVIFHRPDRAPPGVVEELIHFTRN
jgi:hypothetical protein